VLDPKDWFHYDPETGVITWSKDRGKKIKAGTPLVRVNSDGYVTVKLGGKDLLAHRVAWYLYRVDNRIKNLRDVTRGVNARNRLRGGTAHQKSSGRWQARVCIFSKQINLGVYQTKEEAVEVGRKYLEETRP
jgi:hypothetical protein